MLRRVNFYAKTQHSNKVLSYDSRGSVNYASPCIHGAPIKTSSFLLLLTDKVMPYCNAWWHSTRGFLHWMWQGGKTSVFPVLKLLCQMWKISAESLSIIRGSRLPNWGQPSPSFPSPTLPFPFPPLPFLSPFPLLPLEVDPLNTAKGAWEGCKLPQRRLGQSPSRNRIWCILALTSDVWQFY